ncbi:LPXTG cell wall anchor domain-containing protein [Streptomyces dubilierae]|uniref:LPXTG cell wall anchor domain-containing protein n=1 Tax=Streptomyces dubilierae TaxID=3075533 RepID=A0ABU2PJA5_9ACTN|nr:LPXTG cell wall anchor domain-containing protein [Streptomyces sp. DSM 41921]MDT0392248.1 LPXTG cell wall anchor domain-containing protein [Streptomyces sp. DSM 41921]
MRLCTPARLCLAAAAAALFAGAAPAYAEDPAPACAAPDDHTFPLTTRLRGGPDTYTSGGGFGTWYLDLTNTTDRTCSAIHPVVVLVDDRRALEPSQPRLEFFEGARAHPVRFEKTGEDELVGAFTGEEDRFGGFTVGPGETVSVKVRLAVTSDAAPNDVTANAAVVQRHDDDGDWVGQSNDYRFRIEGEEPGTGTEPRPDSDASVPPREDRFPFAEELARTGTGVQVAAATAAGLLIGGGALLLLRRRRS